jgi:ketosteroid isomerase-like protein
VEGLYSLSPHAVFLRPTIELAGGGRFETRLTFVLHRQDGTWRIVHAHTWVGVEQEG